MANVSSVTSTPKKPKSLPSRPARRGSFFRLCESLSVTYSSSDGFASSSFLSFLSSSQLSSVFKWHKVALEVAETITTITTKLLKLLLPPRLRRQHVLERPYGIANLCSGSNLFLSLSILYGTRTRPLQNLSQPPLTAPLRDNAICLSLHFLETHHDRRMFNLVRLLISLSNDIYILFLFQPTARIKITRGISSAKWGLIAQSRVLHTLPTNYHPPFFQTQPPSSYLVSIWALRPYQRHSRTCLMKSTILSPSKRFTMPAKKRCQQPECRNAVMRIAGECPHCQSQYCGTVSAHFHHQWRGAYAALSLANFDLIAPSA
jgi:hypothetical protein